MNRARRAAALAGLAALCAALGGCQSLPAVQAWEKGHLARPGMALDREKLDSMFSDHIYGSREAGLPGRGVGSAGCGCN